MNYVKNDELESSGFISMECPNGCEGGYLVPHNNPNLTKIKDVEL